MLFGPHGALIRLRGSASVRNFAASLRAGDLRPGAAGRSARIRALADRRSRNAVTNSSTTCDGRGGRTDGAEPVRPLRGWPTECSIRDRRVSINVRCDAVADGVLRPAEAVKQ